MTKALLTNINSVWGTIINPQSSNTYRHILSFDNDALKNAFIDKELFGGADHKALLQQQPNIGLTVLTGNLATFRVNPNDYPAENMLSLLNKDFAIIEEDGEYRYYTLIGERKGQMIEYTADLDIFFTHDIKDIFNTQDTELDRVMLDRVKTTNNITEYVANTDGKQTTQFYNQEPIDQVTENSLMIKNIETLKDDIAKYIIPGTLQNEHERIIDTFLNVKWTVMYRIPAAKTLQIPNVLFANNCKPNSNPHTARVSTKHSIYQANLPYSIFLAPVSQGSIIDPTREQDINFYIAKDQNDYDHIDPNKMVHMTGFPKQFIEEADVIQNSYTMSSVSIFNLFNMLKDKVGLTVDTDGVPTMMIKAFPMGYQSGEDIVPVEYTFKDITGTDTSTFHLMLQTVDGDLSKKAETVPAEIKPLPNFAEHATSYTIDNAAVAEDYRTEIKSYFAPYRKLKLKHSTKLEKVLIPQEFKENQIQVKESFGFIPELWNHVVQVKNYNNLIFEHHKPNPGYRGYTVTHELPAESEENFEDIAPYGFPTEQNAYNEYMISHRAQMTAGLFSSTGTGLLSLGGSMMSGNVIGSIGAVTSIASAIGNQYALKHDLKNTPLKLNQTSSTLNRDAAYKYFRTSISEYAVAPYLMTQIRKFFYQYGYNYNKNLDDINKYLKTRYYFNFIQASGTFENIKLQASAEIKQVINDTLEEGITIWHVRDLSKFKGVKNYRYENVEMSYLGRP